MSFKTLIKNLAMTLLAMTSMNALAGATAVAHVSANIVPAVTASMVGSIVLSNTPGTHPLQPTQSASGVSLTTSGSGDAAKVNISSAGHFSYGMSVSSSAIVSNGNGGKMKLANFQLPKTSELVTSDQARELHLNAALEQGAAAETGPFSGSVYITANFN